MKPFDLEAAKRGEPLVTRDGRKVIDLHHFEKDQSDMCLCVHIAGEGSPDWFRANGRKYGSEDSEEDLFMAPKTRKVYVNIYTSTHGESNAWHHNSEEVARSRAKTTGRTVLAVAVPIEIEE